MLGEDGIPREENDNVLHNSNGSDDTLDNNQSRDLSQLLANDKGEYGDTFQDNSMNNNNDSHDLNPSSQNDAEEVLQRRRKQVKHKMKVLTTLAATGGFLFGYDTGVISGAMPPIQRALDLSTVQQETIVSCTVLFAFASSLFGSSLNINYGRKYTILIASFVFSVGSLLMSVAWDYTSLVIGRCIIGIGIGLASLTTPIYIAEVAEPEMRGTLVTVNGLLICFGQFFAGMIDGVFDTFLPNNGWRFMLGLAAVPSLIMFIGFKFFLPESPRWLVMNGYIEEAKEVLMSVRETDEEAMQELREIEQVCLVMNASAGHQNNSDQEDRVELLENEQHNMYDYDNDELRFSIDDENDHDKDFDVDHESNSNDDKSQLHDLSSKSYQQQQTASMDENFQSSTVPRAKSSSPSIFDNVTSMLKHAPTRRALVLGCGMMVLQQLSGINTVMYYAASIYEMSGFDGKNVNMFFPFSHKHNDIMYLSYHRQIYCIPLEQTAIWLSGFTALAQVTGVIISINLIEKKGRRPLVLSSLIFVTLSLIGLGGSFYLARIESDPILHPMLDPSNECTYQKALVWNGIISYCYDCTLIEGCGYCDGVCTKGNMNGPFDSNVCPWQQQRVTSDDLQAWDFDKCSHNKVGYLSVFFMVMYLLSFGIAMGPLPWTINSEIYPLEYRSLAVSFSTVSHQSKKHYPIAFPLHKLNFICSHKGYKLDWQLFSKRNFPFYF